MANDSKEVDKDEDAENGCFMIRGRGFDTLNMTAKSTLLVEYVTDPWISSPNDDKLFYSLIVITIIISIKRLINLRELEYFNKKIEEEDLDEFGRKEIATN